MIECMYASMYACLNVCMDVFIHDHMQSNINRYLAGPIAFMISFTVFDYVKLHLHLEK